jgi:hypothetical protein
MHLSPVCHDDTAHTLQADATLPTHLDVLLVEGDGAQLVGEGVGGPVPEVPEQHARGPLPEGQGQVRYTVAVEVCEDAMRQRVRSVTNRVTMRRSWFHAATNPAVRRRRLEYRRSHGSSGSNDILYHCMHCHPIICCNDKRPPARPGRVDTKALLSVSATKDLPPTVRPCVIGE